MTATLHSWFTLERPFGANIFFAQDPDKDLDFDEGFEEDELNQSKPPSRRPLLWILLLLLVAVVAYWILNDPGARKIPSVMDSGTDNTGSTATASISDSPEPLFRESQIVVLDNETGEAMLMGDSINSRPGPMVQAGEPLTVLDGNYELEGWVYFVRTKSGKTGWISGEKLKDHS